MWDDSVDGEVSHGFEGENDVAESYLQADQEMPPPAEFDLHRALAEAAAVDQDDVEHAEEVVAQHDPDAEPHLVEAGKLVIEEYEEAVMVWVTHEESESEEEMSSHKRRHVC